MSLTFKLKMVFSVQILFQTCVMAFAAVSIQKYTFFNLGFILAIL